jgi:cysteinyl-tRNA synthetase
MTCEEKSTRLSSSDQRDVPMARNEVFHNLSAFYIDMWQHMDAFFDDNRWLRLTDVKSIEERAEHVKAGYAALGEKLHQDPHLAEFVKSDFKAVEALVREYLELHPERGSNWFKRADKLRSYLQMLGLRYAELSSAELEASSAR